MSTEQDYGGDIASVVEKIREQELASQQAAASPPASEQTAEPATESTEGQGEGSTAAPAPADQHGDVRGALRAARRSERQARERAQQLEAELAEARKQIPKPADENLTDAEWAELEADAPLIAKAMKAARAAAPVAAPAPAPAVAEQTDFVPPEQPAAVQDVIDDIPDLLAMQNNPDQSEFLLAVKTDDLLKQHPKWADKPLPERLAECARRVKAELGTPAPAPQPPAPAPAPAAKSRREPAAAVKEAPRAHPSTLSDIAGGAAPTTDTPGVKQFMAMKSDEEIMDALRRHG